MNIYLIDIIGFAAAIITNISFYPQAYDIYIIMNTHQYEKLYTLSLSTFSLTGIGCVLWLIYAIILLIYPVIFGTILTIIPSIYICSVLIYYKLYIYPKSTLCNINKVDEITSIDKVDGIESIDTIKI